MAIKSKKYNLDGLVYLKEVSFSDNEIKKLNVDLFNGLTSLEKIGFNDNQIEELEQMV